MKKKLVLLLTTLMVTVGSLGTALTAYAEESKEYPMYDPQVIDSNYHVYGPSIKINQFSGCIAGCSVLSSKDEIVKMLGGFTQEEWNKGADAILYVADHYEQSEERKLIDETVAAFGGSFVCALDMQLFKYNGSENIRYDEISTPIQLIIGIPEEAHYQKLWNHGGEWEFAMLRVHDGKVDVLKDTDTDVKTLTFNSDKFSIYAMVYAPKGNIDAYLAQNTSTTENKPNNGADEYDEVPKMGDPEWDDFITFGKGRRRG